LTRADKEPAKNNGLTVSAPFRQRLSKGILKRAFHARDQEIFNMFEDARFNTTGGSPFSGMFLTLKPQSGSIEDFDFDLSLENDDLSAGSTNVGFSGYGLYNGERVRFSGNIN